MSRLVESWWWHDALDRPIKIGSPDSGSISVGTFDSGTRSEAIDPGRFCWDAGRPKDIRGGEDDMKCVEDVGIGVG